MKGSAMIALPSAGNLRLHWSERARMTKAQRQVGFALCRSVVPSRTLVRDDDGSRTIPHPVQVCITRIAARALDDDNLRTACKALRDGIADALGLPNDRDPRVEWTYGQRKGRESAVEIEITRREGA